jgi:hypothetical protein
MTLSSRRQIWGFFFVKIIKTKFTKQLKMICLFFLLTTLDLKVSKISNFISNIDNFSKFR